MAVDYAKKRAVYLFARKLQVENASAKVAALKPEEMKRIVRGATILNIRREKEITYADVSVSIVDTELRRALDLPAATAGTLGDTVSASRSVLILPVYRTQERAYLWETENPLRELLRLEVLRQAHGAVLVPAGDFEDLRLIDHNNAAVVTGVELGSMFERYGAEEIIIATATPGAEGTIEPTSITLRRLTPKDVRVEVMKVPVVEVKETAATRLQMAAAAIASAVTQIATSTSYDERRALENASHLKVYFTYANPRELGKMQQSIRGAANVMALEIPNITLQNVSGTIYYSGERQTLKIDLAKQGIVVGERSDGWMLSLR